MPACRFCVSRTGEVGGVNRRVLFIYIAAARLGCKRLEPGGPTLVLAA